MMRTWWWVLSVVVVLWAGVASAQVPRPAAGDDRPAVEEGTRPASPDREPRDAPPPVKQARPQPQVNPALLEALAMQAIANAVTLAMISVFALTLAYLLTFFSKSALGGLKLRMPDTYVVLVRVALGISTAALGALAFAFAGLGASVAAVVGALASALLHDVMDAVRALRLRRG